MARLQRWIRALLPVALLLGLALGWCWPRPAWGVVAAAGQGADARGADLFASHCAGCHIHGGNIIRRGKTLKLAALQRNGITGPEAIARIAAEGIGQMGGYGAVLHTGDPELVAQWVWQQAQNAWIQG